MLGVPVGRGDLEAPEERGPGKEEECGKGFDDWTYPIFK